MRKGFWQGDRDIHALTVAKAERIRALLARSRKSNRAPQPNGSHADNAGAARSDEPPVGDTDFSVLNLPVNDDLHRFLELFDQILTRECPIQLALLWPHVPPRAILPWTLREVGRGLQSKPVRTLFMNMGRPALQMLSGLEANTARLRTIGLNRSGQRSPQRSAREISADAHFYMYLGDTKASGKTAVPLVPIIPHSIAMDDGIYWRDFDEKTLKGYKQYFPFDRLNAIRRHVDALTSAETGPAFAFLLPQHLQGTSRHDALRAIPGSIELVVIDMSTPALGGREPSALLCELLADLEGALKHAPNKVLIVTDCPLRFSHLRRSSATRRGAAYLGTRVDCHRLQWRTRGRGFEAITDIGPSSRPIVETLGSKECIVAARLWAHARELGDENPLSSVLARGAAALKSMALTASTADELLAPYSDARDFYHRLKRERHSFEPHHNQALGLIAEGHVGHLYDAIQADLEAGLALANELRKETPLLRYIKRYLNSAARTDDVLIVLRHPEDAQLAGEHLLDYLTQPGNFQGGIPDLRVTTPSRYAAELASKTPTTVLWAASAISGGRTFIGDAVAPREFRLIVAGQDALTLSKLLEVVSNATEYARYHDRIAMLKGALPWAPKEFGGVAAALALDPDRPRRALPFTGQGYLLLDGYGKVSAGQGSLFYVVDPFTQQLVPREARSIEAGDAVFVMSDAIREEIEALLREKDERGRTLEQAMVDHYKTIVKTGIDTLTRKDGKRPSAARIREMLFQANPDLPSISVQAIDYWMSAAGHLGVDTPYAASDPVHFEAFLKLLGAGVLARQLTDAVRVIRALLRRDGHINRSMFDRLLLDPDSLIHSGRIGFDKLKEFRHEALENVFTVLEKQIEVQAIVGSGQQVKVAGPRK